MATRTKGRARVVKQKVRVAAKAESTRAAKAAKESRPAPASKPAPRTVPRSVSPPPVPAIRPPMRPPVRPLMRAVKLPPTPTMPLRALGRHAAAVSILGLGGGHLVRASQAEAIRTIREALDKGVTLFETGPQYGDGRAERWLGLALQGAAREKATICVQQHAPLRDYKTAMAGLEASLTRLKVDRADIWMIPEVIYDNDPEWIYAHGALDAALEARDQGKVRYIGFAGHKAPHILLKLLAKGHDWDVVAMPLNPLDAHFRSFERHALPELVRRGVAVIGMKAFAGGALSRSPIAKPEDVLRYSLSLPVSSVIVGAESRAVLRKSLAVARDGRLFHAGDMDALRSKTRQVAGDGRLERYKTTIEVDSAPGLLAHGYLGGVKRVP